MAKLQITGRVIALSEVKEIASGEAGKAPMKKRELFLDMTMYDPYTGLRSDKENTPLLEFGGEKVLEKIAGLGLQKDDIVTVTFAIQGTQYRDKQTQKMRVFTAIRCYDIDIVRRAGDGHAFVSHQPTGQSPTTQTAPVSEGQKNEDDLPF